MMLPALALVVWAFREYIDVPWMGVWRLALFLGSIVLAYALLTQIKFLLGISAFWIAEPRRFSRNLEYSDGSFRWPIATAQPVAGLAADSGASVAVRIVIRVSYGTVAWPTEYSGHRVRLCSPNDMAAGPDGSGALELESRAARLRSLWRLRI
jgi:hypothetical protein